VYGWSTDMDIQGGIPRTLRQANLGSPDHSLAGVFGLDMYKHIVVVDKII
jgi:hypothetical protein